MQLYLKKLSEEIIKQGYSETYVEKCIEYAKRLLSNEVPVIFDIQHFSLLTGAPKKLIFKMIFAEEGYYKCKNIPKKSGGYRILHMPSVELKYLQRWILDNILKKIPVSVHATGFCDNKSIVDNAKVHLGSQCVLHMDIQDFFPSISFERVFRLFSYYGYTKEISFLLAKLCTYGEVLPQGSPASPYISNIVALKLDKRLSKLGEKYNARYSRYADDITFSGNSGIKNLVPIVTKILNDEDFIVNQNKTRIQYWYQRQEVTGLLVNDEKVRVKKQYKRDLSQKIYYCLKFGVGSHLEKINCTKSFYKEHLYGRAYFVKMVEPTEGKKFLDLLDQIEWDY